MPYKASFWKKLKKWGRKALTASYAPVSGEKDSLKDQIGKVLTTNGGNIITMTTL